ncbi:MAG TPA: AAA family ATPase [Chloroflexota bacterium]
MKPALRIALAGPEATGKTTLAHMLAERLGLPVLDDPRPGFLAETRCHTLFEAAQYRPVWRELLERQLEREAAPGAAILDTCVLDYWVLWQRWGWCGASPDVSERLYEGVLRACAQLSHVVLMPPAQVQEFQGYRFLNDAYARQVARLTRGLLSEACSAADAMTLTPGPAGDYVEAVLARAAR